MSVWVRETDKQRKERERNRDGEKQTNRNRRSEVPERQKEGGWRETRTK